MKNRRLVLIVIVISIVILGLGLMTWLVARRPVPVGPLPQLPNVEVTPVVPQPGGAVQYSLRASLPAVENMGVYEYAPLDSARDAKTSSLRWPGVLGFSGKAQEIEDALEGTLLLWSKEGQTLVVNEDGTGLSYRVDLKSDPSILAGSFLPTFEQAASIVERTLTELGPPSKLLEYNNFKSETLKTGVEYVQETSSEEAELVEIHFVAKIDEYPIYLEKGPQWSPVLAWVGRDGKLLRLEYTPLGNLGEKIADYPLKNQEELLRDLERGEGTIASSNFEGGEEVVSVAVTKVNLGYLLPSPNANIVQPIFVLQGQARAKSGKTGQVTIYLEAVSR